MGTEPKGVISKYQIGEESNFKLLTVPIHIFIHNDCQIQKLTAILLLKFIFILSKT